MAIEFKDGKYVDPKTGRVTLDPTVYKDWQIAEEAEKKSTRYYMDEFHLLLKEEQTAAYSVEIWKRFRKWGGKQAQSLQSCKWGLCMPS